jgi:EmrB/QacA subfamily drug resistance transporter
MGRLENAVMSNGVHTVSIGPMMTVKPETTCDPSARPYLLAATILASSMAFIDGIVINVALSSIQAQFHVGFDVLQWVVNGYALVLGALILMGGLLGDRYGRRRIFLIGIVLFSVASIACALSPSAATLIAARALQGLGGALLVPQSLAIIAAAYPKDIRGRAVGIWAAAAALTTVSGPILGGILIDLLSWRAVFWINIPLAMVAIGLTLRFVPESHGTIRPATDWLGGLLVTAGLALVTYSATELPQAHEGRFLLGALLTAGIAVLVGFVFHESRSAAPLVPLSIFRSRVFSATNGITVALYFALSVVFFLLPYTLIEVHGYSGLQAGTALVPFGLVMGLLSPQAGKLEGRLGLRVTLAAGAGLVMAGCVAFAVVERQRTIDYWTGYLPVILLFAIGMTISVAPLTTAVLSSVSDDESGVASGINNAISRIAGVMAVAAAGVISLVSFPYFLEAGLEHAAVDAGVRAALLANAPSLAALAVPEQLSGQTAHTLHQLILDAYVNTYCIGMAVAAIAAMGALVIALLYLPSRTAVG